MKYNVQVTVEFYGVEVGSEDAAIDYACDCINRQIEEPNYITDYEAFEAEE